MNSDSFGQTNKGFVFDLQQHVKKTERSIIISSEAFCQITDIHRLQIFFDSFKDYFEEIIVVGFL